MKKTVSVNWEERKSPTNKECWRLIANFTGGNIRLGFINKEGGSKYRLGLDSCEGGIIKVKSLKDVRCLEEAKRNIYKALFLRSMDESNMVEEMNFDWEKYVNPRYKDKTSTLVGEFPGCKIRFAHIRVDMGGNCVMFIDYCSKYPNSKCIGNVKELELAKETVIKRIYGD